MLALGREQMAERHPADLIKLGGITLTMKEMYLSPVPSHLEEVLSGLLGALGKKMYYYFIRCVDKGVSLSNTHSSVPSPPRDGKSCQWQLIGLQEEPM